MLTLTFLLFALSTLTAAWLFIRRRRVQQYQRHFDQQLAQALYSRSHALNSPLNAIDSRASWRSQQPGVAPSVSCAEYWTTRVRKIPTSFGVLVLLASLRAGTEETHRDECDYDPAEDAPVLARLHTRAFRDWLSLNLDQQSRDYVRYMAACGEGDTFLTGSHEMRVLVPVGARDEEVALFETDLAAVLVLLSQREECCAPDAASRRLVAV